MKKLVIAGGSGYLGTVLSEFFRNKVERIYILSRSQSRQDGNIQYLNWDAKTKGPWSRCIEDADVVINLTGKSVDCRYTAKNRSLIKSSRVDSTQVLGEVINASENPPKIWINSSTATIYRHSLHQEMDEQRGEIGSGFSVEVAKAWEKKFFSFDLPLTRQVATRTSIVFGNGGGAFVPIKNLAKIGFGGTQGPGNQKVSWIHEQDFARSVEFLIKKEELSGVVNVVAPSPISNSELMKKLRTQLHAPFGIPLGTSILKIGAKIIKTETELILKSRNVIPKKLKHSGFTFNFNTIDETLNDLIK